MCVGEFEEGGKGGGKKGLGAQGGFNEGIHSSATFTYTYRKCLVFVFKPRAQFWNGAFWKRRDCLY